MKESIFSREVTLNESGMYIFFPLGGVFTAGFLAYGMLHNEALLSNKSETVESLSIQSMIFSIARWKGSGRGESKAS